MVKVTDRLWPEPADYYREVYGGNGRIAAFHRPLCYPILRINKLCQPVA